MVAREAPTSILDAEVVQELLRGDPRPVLLDVRWALATGADSTAFRREHLPGAHFVDLDLDLADPPGAGGRHPLPDPARFQAAMRRGGVDRDSVVICYDANTSMSAARAWWLLRHHGHQTVFVLDGGLAAWTRTGFATESGEGTAVSGDFVAGPATLAAIGVGDVLAGSFDGPLLDARDLERYLGSVEPVDPVAGHIPGAISAPTKENIGADGRFLPKAELARRFEALNASVDHPAVVYCGSGVTAAHEVLAMDVAGYPAILYPGSWSEWIRDENRPVSRTDS